MSKAIAKIQSTALQGFMQRNAGKKKTTRRKGASDRITHRGGILKIGDNRIPGNKVDVVVLDYTLSKNYYDSDFVEGQTTAPTCQAYARDEDDLRPIGIDDPQNETCDGCWANQFETDKRGSGKACSDAYRMFVILAKDLKVADLGGKPPIYTLNVPVKSRANWDEVAEQLDNAGLPYFAGVVTLKTEGMEKGGHQLIFEPETEGTYAEVLTDDVYDALASIVEDDKWESKLHENIVARDPDDDDEKPKAKGTRRRPTGSKKKAAKKKGARKKTAAKTRSGRKSARTR